MEPGSAGGQPFFPGLEWYAGRISPCPREKNRGVNVVVLFLAPGEGLKKQAARRAACEA
jgi:hypothetical protein